MSVILEIDQRQRTIGRSIVFEGVGLHTGALCSVTIHPARVDCGVVFQVCDPALAEDAEAALNACHCGAAAQIPASPFSVFHCDHGTTIANAYGARVATVEHLMAAFALAGVDNALVNVFGPEIPILDGSAMEFIARLAEARVVEQPAKRREIVIEDEILVDSGDRRIVIEPAPVFSVDIAIDFGDCLIGRCGMELRPNDPETAARLARARTFCRLSEVEALRRAGLIRGGSLDNSIVVDGRRILNDGDLRDPEEFALHKALDLVGDLYLLGAPLRGRVRAEKPGHDLNARAALAVARSLEDASPRVAAAV